MTAAVEPRAAGEEVGERRGVERTGMRERLLADGSVGAVKSDGAGGRVACR